MIKLIIIVLAIVVAWKVFVRLWNMFRPVRSYVGENVTNGLQAAGMDNAAKAYHNATATIESAVDRNTRINPSSILLWVCILSAVFGVLVWFLARHG